MLLPMIPLAIGVAIPDEHTRFTCLETNTPFIAALGTAVDRCIVRIDHYFISTNCERVGNILAAPEYVRLGAGEEPSKKKTKIR